MNERRTKKDLEQNPVYENRQYLMNFAHDLATPITVITGYAQILKEEALSQEELYIRAIDNIQIQSKILQSIIEEYIKD